MKIEELFKKYDHPIKNGTLNKPLIELRGHQCEQCKNTEWLGNPITLEVHHIDGDKSNNELSNLQLLCPNCHSYTDNYGSKNIKKPEVDDSTLIQALKTNSSIRQALFSLGMSDAGANYNRVRKLVNNNHIIIGEEIGLQNQTNKKEKYCKTCGKMILPTSTYCIDCYTLAQRIVDRPEREELKNMIRTMPFTKIAEKYGVSDRAIAKWCIAADLPSRKKDINNYSEEEWKNI